MYSRRRIILHGANLAAGAVCFASCGRSRRREAVDSTTSSGPSPTTVASTSAAPVTTSQTPPWSEGDFDELDRFVEKTNGEAFAIMENGTIVHEWYRGDGGYVRDIASAQKSVLSMLVGRAIGDGLLALDSRIDDVLGSDWTPHGQSSTIGVGHLLSMTSGLDDELEIIAEPGSTWRYSQAFAKLFDVLEVVTDRDIEDVAAEWLFEPAGADTARFYRRPAGRFAPIGLLAGVDDLLAIGQTIHEGSQPGLAESWLDDSFTASQPFNDAYGYLWWRNGGDSFLLPASRAVSRTGPLIPTGPTDLVAAMGKDDQRLYISRELGLSVARLGGRSDPAAPVTLSSFDTVLWEMLTRLRG